MMMLVFVKFEKAEVTKKIKAGRNKRNSTIEEKRKKIPHLTFAEALYCTVELSL